MSSRVAGAGLALIAAALLAAVVATPVLVPAEYSLFAGHPTVAGRTRETQEVYVGLYDARLCNSGGDQTCKSGDPIQPFQITGFSVLGAIGVTLLGSVALLGLALANSRRRRGIAIVTRIAGVLALGGSVGLAVQQPFREATIPVSPIGAGLYGAAILMGLLASVVAGRKPSAVQLRKANRQAPQAPAAPAPGFDVQAMFAGEPEPEHRVPESYASDPFAPGADQVPSASSLRPLYGAAPHHGGLATNGPSAPSATNGAEWGGSSPYATGATPHAMAFDTQGAPTDYDAHRAPTQDAHAMGFQAHSAPTAFDGHAPHAMGFEAHSAPTAFEAAGPGAMGFESGATDGLRRPPPPPPRAKAPSAAPPSAETRTQPSFVPPMPSPDPFAPGSFDLSAAYDPPPSVMPEGSARSGTDVNLYPGIERNAPSPRERVDTPLAPPPPPIAQAPVIPPPWATDNAAFDPAAFETGHAHALETVRFETPMLSSLAEPTPPPVSAPPAAASPPPPADAPPAPSSNPPRVLTPVPTLTPAALTAMLPPPLPRPPRENFSRIDRNPLGPSPAARATVPMPARPAAPTARPPIPPTRPPPPRVAVIPPAVIPPIPAIPMIRPIGPGSASRAPASLDDLDDDFDDEPSLGKETISDEVNETTNVSVDLPLPNDVADDLAADAKAPRAKPPMSTAPESLPPPKLDSQANGPSPACPQCESPMDWVDEHLRFYCKSCRMYF